MQATTTYILFWSIGGSLIILIGFLFFINYILKLYNKKEIEYNTTLKLKSIEKEKEILINRVEAQEETIQKISREIHDNVNQLLTLSKLNLNNLKCNKDAEFDNKIELSNSLISSAIKELTNISRSLSAETVNEFGLAKSLESEISRLTQIEDIKINLEVIEKAEILNPEVQLDLYRIFQEATRNAIIHGNPKNINVSLQIDEKIIKLLIIDDGIGFDLEMTNSKNTNKSQGLLNMQKRTKLINGSLEINTNPNNGTKITLIIPQQLIPISINNLVSHTIHY
ncbi:sensor histidine kinase [Flavihumibacter stibioxidans]|uniref:histidine kinase n=1 Tax=Flavihumibacter stibioxidans TaxID=1834163 RepID=A0ABR7MC70_9BACT|nr:ATP-binding protein [Flavihumibacter stibioxidans]MBC6492631.1 hypothetical protein [Flavihumibacter stibioxidans]